jgi:hypothetical protein
MKPLHIYFDENPCFALVRLYRVLVVFFFFCLHVNKDDMDYNKLSSALRSNTRYPSQHYCGVRRLNFSTYLSFRSILEFFLIVGARRIVLTIFVHASTNSTMMIRTLDFQ